MNGLPLYRSVETAAAITDRVLVAFSGGKDSVVTLDLCMKHFAQVEAFFMFYVRGLSFQENICRYYEDKYGIPIHRIPHFEVSQWLRYGLFRFPDFDSPIVSTKETYDYIRENTGIWWIAAGERISDSIVRRAMIKSSGTIDTKRGRFFPIAEWDKPSVKAYIRQRKLRVGIESEKLGFSFRSFMPKDLIAIRDSFPGDYGKIREWFPLVDASIIQHEMKQVVQGNGQSK